MKHNKTTANYTKIAIIGNGFDKAHGYATGYDDFITDIGEDYFGEYKELLRDYCGTDIKWSDFEDRVGALAAAFFQRLFSDDADYEKTRAESLEFNSWFLDLHDKLAEYLRKETAKKDLKKFRSISRVLKKNTLAVNFNYTDTVSYYHCPVSHVHGSLLENDIVLGFDPPMAGCFTPYESEKWHKVLRRDSLEFRRYVRSTLAGNIADADYDKLVDGYEEILNISTSGKGFEDEDINGWDYEKIYREFLRQKEGHYEWDWDGICVDSVKQLFVIGHGIIADKEYLLSLLRKCTQLQKVIIFSYDGESAEEWQQKADFFKPFCKKVLKRRYTRLSRGC